MRKGRSLFATLFFIIMSVFSYVSVVQAMEPCTAELSVFVEGGGTVKIEGISAPAGMEIPMPENTVIAIQDKPVKLIMQYEEPGEYMYSVRQMPGSQSGVTYDDSVFTISISVFVKEDGGLQAVITSKKDSEKEKPADILFVNTKPTPAPTLTPAASGQNTTYTQGNAVISPAGKSGNVQTGDENMMLNMIATGISLAGIIGVLVWKKKTSR